jgi:hypothetical protein
MSGKWTNGAGLALAYGCTRQHIHAVLQRGDIPAARPPRVEFGRKTSWRIPCDAADRWLRRKGKGAPRWVKVKGAVGRWSDVWVPSR